MHRTLRKPEFDAILSPWIKSARRSCRAERVLAVPRIVYFCCSLRPVKVGRSRAKDGGVAEVSRIPSLLFFIFKIILINVVTVFLEHSIYNAFLACVNRGLCSGRGWETLYLV